MTTHVYFPLEWSDLQSLIIRKRPDLWKAIQGLDKNEAIAYLNIHLQTKVQHDALLKDAAFEFSNAIMRQDGILILPNGKMSK